MHRDELKELFDKQAAGYDAQWAKTAPIRDCLHFLLEAVFADLPGDARILCIGVGTGAELVHLARKHPHWRFTAVEPAGAMLEVCRQRVLSEGLLSRCDFHEGYLESLAVDETHQAATCFLVSQFLLERHERVKFFREIANRLAPGGILATSDLASEVGSDEFESLFQVWANVMAAADLTPEAVERMRQAYAKDVAVLAPTGVASIIEAGGFEVPVQFFQSGLIHAWFCKRKGG